MPKIWIFSTTEEAYDASQSSDVIKDGDVLVATEERVVGFLFQAWPTAVTDNGGDPARDGAFHRATDDNFAALTVDPLKREERLLEDVILAAENFLSSMGTEQGFDETKQRLREALDLAKNPRRPIVDYAESARVAQGEAARLASLDAPWSATDTDFEVLYPEYRQELLEASLGAPDHDDES